MFGVRTKVVPPVRTLRAMESAAPSPFLEVPEAEWVCANDLCFAIFDSFLLSPRASVIGENKDGSGFPRGDGDGSRVQSRSGPSKGNPLPSPFSPGARNLRRFHEPANGIAALWRPDRIHPGG
jgi:hypothetical protein